MLHDLTNKTALVGGSTQGIGWAVALKLAERGARVVLLARNEDKLRAAAAQLPTPAQQQHTYLVADYAQPDQVAAAVNAFLAAGNTVHVLVNNTGGPAAGPLLDAEPDAFVAAFQQHLINNQRLAQAVVPGMRASGYGRIVNIISTSVKVPLHGLGVSNTVRAAVGNWSKTLANELAADGITVNNVLPGATQTGRLAQIIHNKAEKTGKSDADVSHEMASEVPMKRLAQPQEIAAAIAFLASPAASYINGINVPVDGGRTLCL